MNPILLTDFYKTEHWKMMPPGTSMIYSNLTPRKSRIDGVDHIVFFGLQHFVKKYLLGKFKTEFFDKPWEEVEEEYKFAIPTTTDHIKELHDLGYLPLQIKAVPEGTLVPIGVPALTIRNTHSKFAWLTNYLETLLSAQLWQPCTSATIAYEYKKLLTKFALETTGKTDFVQWQGHDFSMRGMSSVESAILSGMGHLLSFTGTDTIPAIYALRNSYKATGLIGASVPATEHSVMSMGTKDNEIETFRRLLKTYPTGFLSVVSDTWSLPFVVTEILPKLKDEILARDGKLVIRPDSFWTNPEDCICGFDGYHPKMYKMNSEELDSIRDGLVESLYNIFGGTKNEKGYIELDPRIGCIYGDSISLDRAETISTRLREKGFATTNIVYGIGSFTYQHNTRDTFGFAVKATYGELTGIGPDNSIVWQQAREIYKDPITDDGTKKSAKGLLKVVEVVEHDSLGKAKKGGLRLVDQVDWEGESQGVLEPVFVDGKLVREETLEDIRNRLRVE